MNEFLFAQLTALIANTSFRSFEDPKEPKDYMPSQWAKQTERSASTNTVAEPSQEERNAAVANLFRTLFVNNGIMHE